MEADEDARQGLVHGLRWGLKKSFLDYIRGMPDGRGSVGDGAVPVGTGDLFYAHDAERSGAGVWAFRGDVRFSGHFGLLFVRVANPWLEVDDSSVVVSIEDPQARTDAPRVPLVAGTLRRLGDREGTEVWGSDDVALTAAGVELFNDVYAEGEPFEPLVAQLPLGRAG
ncbi:HtaA domain-containing protein [Yinghuangia sp. ASG 101]|uniref:HtaA domain-containing protein n=1 Tax=Yinghuangia sp. ASG 101 TaxID=2896848 RepID=UPI001E48EB87|nr:HtaA domain-containing protein [Yinghuangia sp. ASG 101]UGQ11087.1 HtaA domain-containing protein [Yinghuangia sp. ASG 101]